MTFAATCRLPSVMFLNGSKVSEGEREDAERFFIRFYQDCPAQELSDRYRSQVLSGKSPQN